MNRRGCISRFVYATVAAACSALAAPAQSCDTAKVLAQMDAASARFQSAQADFKWDVLQSVVNEHDIQSGTIYFARHGGDTSMAAYIQQPAPKAVFYSGGTLTLVQPEIKQETLFNTGSNREQAESFLTIGFGGSGKDLFTNWDVSCEGMEPIDGTPTAKLELKPKQQSVANLFTHVTVWIDPAKSISLRQIFYEPSGDNRTATYTNLKYNQKISADTFKPKDKGFNIVRK
jgi:outer membrane lipoprotein-sorting protein